MTPILSEAREGARSPAWPAFGGDLRVSRRDLAPAVIVLASLAALSWLFEVPGAQLAGLVLLLSIVYAAARWSGRLAGPSRSRARSILLGATALAFVFRKTIPLWPSYSGIAVVPQIGLAFLLPKVVSFIFEKPDRPEQGDSWLAFLSYCLFAPTYLVGPIFDYRFYRRELAASITGDERWTLLLQGTRRVILGLFKTRVLAFITSHYTFFTWPASSLVKMPWYCLLGIVHLTFLDLYFNFSGYTDIAIGASNCLGFSMPENFRFPYASTDLQDFWQRWHVSLAEWLRTFVFYPVCRELMRLRALRSRPVAAAGLAIMATFAVMGLWHGTQANYLVYGLVHGAGLAAYLGGRQLFRSEELQNPVAKSLAALGGRLLTLHYVAFALILFYADDGPRRYLLLTVLRSRF